MGNPDIVYKIDISLPVGPVCRPCRSCLFRVLFVLVRIYLAKTTTPRQVCSVAEIGQDMRRRLQPWHGQGHLDPLLDQHLDHKLNGFRVCSCSCSCSCSFTTLSFFCFFICFLPQTPDWTIESGHEGHACATLLFRSVNLLLTTVSFPMLSSLSSHVSLSLPLAWFLMAGS